MIKLLLKEKHWGIGDDGYLLSRAARRRSSLYTLAQDHFCLTNQMLVHLGRLIVPTLSEIIECVEESTNSLSEFSKFCQYHITEEWLDELYDIEMNSISSMISDHWQDVGVRATFNRRELDGPSIVDILQQSDTTAIVPVAKIKTINPEIVQARAVVCAFPVTDKKDTLVHRIEECHYLSYKEIHKNTIWSAQKDGKHVEFEIGDRLAYPKLLKTDQSYMTALASALTCLGQEVIVCHRNHPNLISLDKVRGAKREFNPNYAWKTYDPDEPFAFLPIEPKVVRDFCDHGDRNIQFVLDDDTEGSKYDWQKDEEYMIPF